MDTRTHLYVLYLYIMYSIYKSIYVRDDTTKVSS